MKIAKYIDRTIEYGFYSLFFVTPLLFNPSRTLPSFELFEWNKMIFVYTVTAVIVSSWIVRMIFYKKLIFQRTFLDLPLLLYLLSQVLSTIFSIDPHVSLFGYYSRFHGGLLSTISYSLLYFAFVSNRELFNFKKITYTILFGAAGVSLYGIAEKFGIDAHMWVQDVRNRVFSTLGQPNWLAAYLAILLPIPIGKIVIHTKVKKYVWIFTLCSWIFYVCLLFTKSRSGFLGFWTANTTFWTAVFFINRLSFKKTIPIFLFFNSSLLILNFFIRTPFSEYNRLLTQDVFNKTPVVEDTKPPVGDSVINVGVTDSSDIRRIVWKGAYDIAKTYPSFGTGPETFAYSYYKFRPVEHNLTSEWDFLYNRAHNEFLNILATSGFFGLGTYLLLICTVLFWSGKHVFTHEQNRVFLLSLISSYLSILVTNFFGFSVVVVGLFFFLIPAMIYSLTYVRKPPELPHAISTKQFGLSGAVGLGFLFLLVIIMRFWIADSLYARGLSLTKQEEYESAYPYIEEAIKLRPDEPVYQDEMSLVSSQLALLYMENSEATKASTLLRSAIDASNKALKTSPQNVSFWKTRTKMYFAFAPLDQAFTQHALDSILVAHELAPTDPKIAYNAAVIYGHANKNKEAVEMLQKTIDLKPDYRDAYIALAIFYEEEKQIDKAIETLELALKRINPDDTEIRERIEKLK